MIDAFDTQYHATVEPECSLIVNHSLQVNILFCSAINVDDVCDVVDDWCQQLQETEEPLGYKILLMTMFNVDVWPF